MPKIISSDIKKLPKKYHDAPRFPVVVKGYEERFKDNYKRTINNTVKLLKIKLNNFIK